MVAPSITLLRMKHYYNQRCSPVQHFVSPRQEIKHPLSLIIQNIAVTLRVLVKRQQSNWSTMSS